MDRPEALIRILPLCLHWHPDGEIRLLGHRIGLYHFVFYYNQGFTAEMLQCQFPTLRPPDLRDFDVGPSWAFRAHRRSSRRVADWCRDRGTRPR